MFLTCLRKELLQNMLSLRYALVSLLFVALVFGATVVRSAVYRKQIVDHAELQARTAQAMAEMQTYGHWGTSKNFGHAVEKAPNPLAVFVFGLENEMTRAYSQGGWYAPYLGPRKLHTTGFEYNLAFDVATVVCIVGSLLALVLSFDAICGESERGTLKVLLCGSIPRDTIILSKVCAGALTQLVPLAIGWTLSLWYALTVGGVDTGPEGVARLAAIMGLSALYVVFFQALGTAISSFVSHSATSLAAALFAWVVLVLIVPNVVPMAAARLAPIPQISKLNVEKDAIRDEIVDDSATAWSLSAWETQKFENAGQMWGSELLPRLDVETARRAEKLDALYQARVSNQAHLAQAMSRASPAAAFMYAVTGLAGTGVSDFMQTIRDHQLYNQRFTVEVAELESEAKKRQREDEEVGTAYGAEAYPAFEPTSGRFGSAMLGSLFDVGYLVLGAVLLFMASYAGFMRYDPR